MKRRFILLLTGLMALTISAQSDRIVQNKPYIDLRPVHFGILVGTHLQDLELETVGPYMMTDADGNVSESTRPPSRSGNRPSRSLKTR